MNQYQPDQILSELEYAIQEQEAHNPEPMPGDKWLLASAMQKAIRRNEPQRAARAVMSLWYQDRQSFWRRLHVTALEDVGIGDVSAVVKTLTVTSSPSWRRQVGDLQAGLYLVQLLCGAVKSRLADEIFITAEKEGSYTRLRARLAKADEETLLDMVADVKKSLVQRCLAIWYLAGTKKYTSDLIPPRTGSFEETLKVLRSLKKLPEGLVESCISVANRTQWPLALFLPVVWQEVRKHELHIHQHTIPSALEVDGLPHYAADMYTRVGKACIRQLHNTVASLHSFSTQQIEHALFYVEGGRVDRELTAPALQDMQQESEAADMECCGLSLTEYLELRDLLEQHMDVLAEIRHRQLKRYLEGGL